MWPTSIQPIRTNKQTCCWESSALIRHSYWSMFLSCSIGAKTLDGTFNNGIFMAHENDLELKSVFFSFAGVDQWLARPIVRDSRPASSREPDKASEFQMHFYRKELNRSFSQKKETFFSLSKPWAPVLLLCSSTSRERMKRRMKVWSRCVIVTVMCEAVRLGSSAESVFRLYIDIHANLFSRIKKRVMKKRRKKRRGRFHIAAFWMFIYMLLLFIHL